jgi:hypothetical protein
MKIDLPKRKTNYFYIYDKNNKNYVDVKYICQNTLAEGYIQVMPKIAPKKLINHFSITLAFLPDHLWCKLKEKYKNKENKENNEDDKYRIIKDGITRYSIVETNQDDMMFTLYDEIHKINPKNEILQFCVDNLDVSQHSSWLIIRTKHYIKTGILFSQENISTFNEEHIKLIY